MAAYLCAPFEDTSRNLRNAGKCLRVGDNYSLNWHTWCFLVRPHFYFHLVKTSYRPNVVEAFIKVIKRFAVIYCCWLGSDMVDVTQRCEKMGIVCFEHICWPVSTKSNTSYSIVKFILSDFAITERHFEAKFFTITLRTDEQLHFKYESFWNIKTEK